MAVSIIMNYQLWSIWRLVVPTSDSIWFMILNHGSLLMFIGLCRHTVSLWSNLIPTMPSFFIVGLVAYHIAAAWPPRMFVHQTFRRGHLQMDFSLTRWMWSQHTARTQVSSIKTRLFPYAAVSVDCLLPLHPAAFAIIYKTVSFIMFHQTRV